MKRRSQSVATNQLNCRPKNGAFARLESPDGEAVSINENRPHDGGLHLGQGLDPPEVNFPRACVEFKNLLGLPFEIPCRFLGDTYEAMIDFLLWPESVRNNVGNEIFRGRPGQAFTLIKLARFVPKFCKCCQQLIIID